jgi:hypothetical protein
MHLIANKFMPRATVTLINSLYGMFLRNVVVELFLDVRNKECIGIANSFGYFAALFFFTHCRNKECTGIANSSGYFAALDFSTHCKTNISCLDVTPSVQK